MKLDKELMEINFYELDEIRRKFGLLDINRADFFLSNYVNYLIKDTNISIFGRDISSAVDLVYNRKLEGYCFESTSILVPSFNDDDFISRGNLFLTSEGEEYFHSWINFSLRGRDYVFDPSLSLLCQKELYDELFKVEIMSIIPSVKVKDELIGYLNKNDEVNIIGTDNIDSSFYRGDIKVRGKVKKNKIQSLYVRY